MEIVNINDIEQLVICKYKIETELLENGKIDKKQTLDEFLSTYAYLNMIYKVKNMSIPFGLKKINGIDYLFVISENKIEIEVLINKLKLLRYDINNLVKIPNDELLKTEDTTDMEFIVYNNAYYR